MSSVCNIEKKPTDNPLKPYLSALEKDKGSDSHAGLEGFEEAWKNAANDSAMIEVQNEIINQQYKEPAIDAARQDGLCNLGLYIYYDALIVHGPGDDPDSFGGIRQAAMKQARTPAEGGGMTAYLNAFLDAQTDVMEHEEAHRDLSRIETQRQFLKEGNFALKRPLSWTMYGDHFELK